MIPEKIDIWLAICLMGAFLLIGMNLGLNMGFKAYPGNKFTVEHEALTDAGACLDNYEPMRKKFAIAYILNAGHYYDKASKLMLEGFEMPCPPIETNEILILKEVWKNY